jgi:hypothetical protein
LFLIFGHELAKRKCKNNSDDAHDKERISEQLNCVHLLASSRIKT